jgi:3-oxoacyl-[acyl-carrier-protein] synthase-3
MRRAMIKSTGRYLPENVVSNFDLEEICNTSDEWIRQRTGIVERRYAADNEGAADMGAQAAKIALERAGIDPGDIQLIIFATLSPDYNFPGSACVMQSVMALPPGIPALDIRQQCTGFIYGLSIADQYIKTGMYDRILIVGSEVHSTGLDFSPSGRDVTVIFGDGAGAAVVTPAEREDQGVLSCHLHADGNFFDSLWTEIVASKLRPRITEEHLKEGRHYPKMQGRKVFKYAVQYMPDAVNEALRENSLTVEDIDLLICHQANMRINQMVASQLNIAEEKVPHNIQRYGNTTAATIPILLDECIEDGRLKEGDLSMLVSFGAGFTWASAAVRW